MVIDEQNFACDFCGTKFVADTEGYEQANGCASNVGVNAGEWFVASEWYILSGYGSDYDMCVMAVADDKLKKDGAAICDKCIEKFLAEEKLIHQHNTCLENEIRLLEKMLEQDRIDRILRPEADDENDPFSISHMMCVRENTIRELRNEMEVSESAIKTEIANVLSNNSPTTQNR